FGAFLRLPPRASEERLITLTRALGRLRNADVSSALLAPVAATTKGREADRLAEVLDALDLERRQESRRTRVLLRRPRTLRTIGELRDWLEAPAFAPGAETPLAVAVGPILLRVQRDGLEDWDELRARASWRASSPAREPEPV